MTKTDHLLVILMEECAEVQHACAKALRFGLDDVRPIGQETNREAIRREAHELIAVLEMCEHEGIFGVLEDEKAERICLEKQSRIEQFLSYSRERRRLTDG